MPFLRDNVENLEEQGEHIHNEHICVGQLIGNDQSWGNENCVMRSIMHDNLLTNPQVFEGLTVPPKEGKAMKMDMSLHGEALKFPEECLKRKFSGTLSFRAKRVPGQSEGSSLPSGFYRPGGSSD